MFVKSIVALVTPFNDEHQIDWPSLAKLIDWHIASGTSAIVLAGTTGESATLTDDEKVQLAEFAVQQAKGNIQIILGNGSNNTAHSVALTKRLSELAITGFLTVTPYYNKPTAQGLIAHFSAIANATELPIILYNVPGRTQCDMSNEVVTELAKVPNIVGLKDATADLSRVSPLRQALGDNFALLSGDDATAMAYVLAGGDGVISVTANIVPSAIAQQQAHLAQGNIEQAKQLDQQLASLHDVLFIESNPIAVKWALTEIKQLANGGLRLPLTELSDVNQVKVKQVLKACQLISGE